MNRETKRMMQRQGQMEEDGSPAARKPPGSGGGGPRGAAKSGQPARKPASQRTSPAQFMREVRDELRQVAWPTRSELANYTAVVLTTLILMIAMIFVFNYVFGKFVIFLFTK